MPDRSGACEARLFLFTGHAHGEVEPPAKRGAARDLALEERQHVEIDGVRLRSGNAVREVFVGFRVPFFSNFADRGPAAT